MPRQSDALANDLIVAVEQLGGTAHVDRRDTCNREHIEMTVMRGRTRLDVHITRHGDDPVLLDLRARFSAAHSDGASSNDIAQLLDDFLTSRGLPTVLYG